MAGAGDLIVAYVVDLEVAGIGIPQHHVRIAGRVTEILAGDAAEIANSEELPIQADRADGGRTGDLIVAYVVDLECAGGGVAQQHVAGKAFIDDVVETAESDKLPIVSDRELRAGRDCIIS